MWRKPICNVLADAKVSHETLYIKIYWGRSNIVGVAGVLEFVDFSMVFSILNKKIFILEYL